MSAQRIDREEWASLIAELVVAETRGNKSAFARLVGVDYKTLMRWLRKTQDVSEDSIRRVAGALGRNPMELLVRIGYYRAAEVGQPEADVDYDAEIERVRDHPELAPHMKVRIIERIMELRRLDEERRRAVIDMMIEQAKGA